MQTANSERLFVQAVTEAARDAGIKVNTFSQDWIIGLESKGRTKYIFGYNFDLNGASGYLITNDKCAAVEVLNHSGISTVEHRLFLHPNLAGYVESKGNWQEIMSYFQRSKSDVVCKSNVGTGGNQVYRAQSFLEREIAVQKLFSSNRAIALSPFINIESEYRLIMLDENCELAYEKVRPQVTGDGFSTLSELITKKYSDNSDNDKLIANLAAQNSEFLSSIPEQNECVTLSWKHNLGKGARAVEIVDEQLKAFLSETAVRCMKALNLSFVSIDIVKTGDRFSVMEINSGIMMESYGRQGENEYAKAKEIYGKAIMKMLSY